MEAMTVGSLFAGIGGFDLGFERAGMRSVWQSDIDPYCLRVLEKHWPDVLRVPDIRDVGAATVPYVDVICGGFPCQDLSYAGTGAGLDGARSGLWSEYARVIGELRPRYVVVENVSALLARGMGVVVGDLASLGYDAEWDCLPASAFGAPHRRDRVWLVAYPNTDGRTEGLRIGAGRGERPRSPDAQRCGQHLGDTHSVAWASPDPRSRRSEAVDRSGAVERAIGSGGVGGDVQDADGGALQPWRVGGRVAQAGGAEWWASEPPFRRVAHGVPNRLDRLAALGNALVPQIAEWIGRRIVDYEGGLT